ncbi:MAG: class A beta-lactamase-related serine hydrolase [Treponema sp.]|nr:class A beta-lactamase-related serine hydrolase [Treponema sp.]
MWFEKAKQLIGKAEGEVGLLVKNLNTGETLAYNEDKAFTSASTIKVPILLALMDEVEAGRLDLNSPAPVSPEEVVPGAGIVQFLSTGLPLTISDHATMMIDLSDNTSTNKLISTLGFDVINGKCKALSLKDTVLGRKMMDFKAREEGKDNYTSCRDMLIIFESIHANPKKYEPALKILKQQIVNNLLPALTVPDEFDFAHKTGELPGVRHDVGIMYLSAPIFVAYFSMGFKRELDTITLANEIGLLIYNEYK